MAIGWVALSRDSLDSEVFQDADLWRLWSWCLLSANWKPSTWKGKPLQPGQFIAGRISASDQLRISPSKWYRGIQRLVDLGLISIQANSTWTTVTVCDWRSYQPSNSPDRTADEQPMNTERTADEQQVNTDKQGNKDSFSTEKESKPPTTTEDVASAMSAVGEKPREEALNENAKMQEKPRRQRQPADPLKALRGKHRRRPGDGIGRPA